MMWGEKVVERCQRLLDLFILTCVIGNGSAHFGDVFAISPKSVDHSAGGSGTYNAGDFVQFFSSPNVTFMWDIDLISQQKSFNA